MACRCIAQQTCQRVPERASCFALQQMPCDKRPNLQTPEPLTIFEGRLQPIAGHQGQAAWHQQNKLQPRHSAESRHAVSQAPCKANCRVGLLMSISRTSLCGCIQPGKSSFCWAVELALPNIPGSTASSLNASASPKINSPEAKYASMYCAKCRAPSHFRL